MVLAAPEQLPMTPMNGKNVCGRANPLRAAIHLLALLDQPTEGVLRQNTVDAKTNEHKAALGLLEGLLWRAVSTAATPGSANATSPN
jgi:hypothetical protein